MRDLSLNNVRISYADDSHIVLDISSVTFQSGLNFLIGKNGSGKTTLLKSLTDQFQNIIVEGDIQLNGNSKYKSHVGLVNQNPSKSIIFELSFVENLIFARLSRRRYLSVKSILNKTDIAAIKDFLDGFSMLSEFEILLNVEGGKLSAGQQQLLAILMRLIRFQNILLLDECTANLDDNNTKMVINVLLQIAKKGTIILFATHDHELLNTPESCTFKIQNKDIHKLSTLNSIF